MILSEHGYQTFPDIVGPRGEQRNCIVCGKAFSAKTSNQKYCHDPCRPQYTPVTVKIFNQRECRVCGQKYSPQTANQAYCGLECRQVANKYQPVPLQDRLCVRCGSSFQSSHSGRKYCSSECRAAVVPQKRIKPASLKLPPIGLAEEGECRLDDYNLYFTDEEDFAKWFDQNFFLFGIKALISHGVRFPDVLAKMFSGQILRIELEFHASNFKRHGHNSQGCDLIISYVKSPRQHKTAGVPVIALFNVTGHKSGTTRFKLASRRVTRFFRSIINSGSLAVSRLLNLPSYL